MLYAIWGYPGAGKSSLMAYFLNESAYDFDRIKAGLRELKEIYDTNKYDLPLPRHLTFINGDLTFKKDGYRKRESLYCDPFSLGIKSEAPEGTFCQMMPAWSTWGIDEAQTYFPSTETGTPLQVYNFSVFEKNRHNDLNIYMTTTRVMLLHKRIREISYGMHVVSRKIYQDIDGRTKICWTVNFIEMGNIDNYLLTSGKEQKQYYTRKKYVCNYNIFDVYNSQGHRQLFSNGYTADEMRIKTWRES